MSSLSYWSGRTVNVGIATKKLIILAEADISLGYILRSVCIGTKDLTRLKTLKLRLA